MRFRRVILWILLALLPLRGWATSDMQVSMAMSAATASSMQAAPEAQHHGAAPCHGHAATDDVDGAPEPSSGSHAACSLCDLCHSVAIATTQPQLGAMPTAARQRLSLVSTNTGHALIDRLDRPPRTPLPV